MLPVFISLNIKRLYLTEKCLFIQLRSLNYTNILTILLSLPVLIILIGFLETFINQLLAFS